MHRVEPRVFLVGETKLVNEGLREYLDSLGVPEWDTNAPSDIEKLTEVMGRMCYRSFKPGLNPNVTKVREGSDKYLGNILNTKHGSVIEHGVVNFIFANVSRVFTHELVRHRQGTAMSQESLRYVRLEDLGQWLPADFRNDPVVAEKMEKIFKSLEEFQMDMAKHFELDKAGTDFHLKKTITSAMRRAAPIGLATAIGWSVNLRALRWVIEMRTAPEAEEEIRLVFGKVGEIVAKRYPNLFQDFTVEMVNGLPWFKPTNSKV